MKTITIKTESKIVTGDWNEKFYGDSKYGYRIYVSGEELMLTDEQYAELLKTKKQQEQQAFEKKYPCTSNDEYQKIKAICKEIDAQNTDNTTTIVVNEKDRKEIISILNKYNCISEKNDIRFDKLYEAIIPKKQRKQGEELSKQEHKIFMNYYIPLNKLLTPNLYDRLSKR